MSVLPAEGLTFSVSIASSNAAIGALRVLGFHGSESLSAGLHLFVELATVTAGTADVIDLAQLLDETVTLTLKRGANGRPLTGTVAAAWHTGCHPDQRQTYRIELESPLARLGRNRRTRVFRKKSVPQLIDELLGPAQIACDKLLAGAYKPLEHCMQYEESDLDFLNRLLEGEGICHFLLHRDGEAKVVFTDRADGFPAPAGPLAVHLHDAGDVPGHAGALKSLTRSAHAVAKDVRVRDYDAKHPTTPLEEPATVKAQGAGIWGSRDELVAQRLADSETNKRYAGVRAQEIAVRRVVCQGGGDAEMLRAGHMMLVRGHPAGGYDGEYLLLSVHHRWSSKAGITGQGYRNSFTAVPKASLPWRPPRATPRPVIPGMLHGTVSGTAGDHDGLEIDGAYRVKVLMQETDAERVVRMAQPYAGPDQGIHFPLPPDTEVLLAHVNGDPDRPVIAAAIPNVETPSPVTEANKTQCVIRSASGNQLHFEDADDHQEVHLTAVRDLIVEVAHDRTETVRGKYDLNVAKTLAATVDDRADLTVKKGFGVKVTEELTVEVGKDSTLTLKGALTQTVAKDMELSVTGARSDKVKKDLELSVDGARSDTVKKAMTLNVTDGLTGKAKKITLTADDGIELKTGQASIVLKPSGEITIKGSNILVQGSGKIALKAPQVKGNG